MSGYSGTPLEKKLGVKDGMRVVVLGAPEGFALEGVEVETRLGEKGDLVVFFTKERAKLEARVGALRRAVEPDGMVWVAWPKRASRVATDMSEDVVREVVLPMGLVDVKVCAIDEVWSGLKVVVRKELR